MKTHRAGLGSGVKLSLSHGADFVARQVVLTQEEDRSPQLVLQQYPDGHKLAPGRSITVSGLRGEVTVRQIGAMLAHPSQYLDLTPDEREHAQAVEWLITGCVPANAVKPQTEKALVRS